jgi:hypothetical protein
MADSTSGHGVHVRFYSGAGQDWKFLPLFKDLTVGQEWNTYEFGLDRDQILALLKGGEPVFAAVFTSYLQIDKEGDYTFYNSSDDGSKLFIDNKRVVDNDGNHGVIQHSGDIHLEAGKHAIRVEYYNGFGGFWLDAYYKGPGVPRQLIPADKLYLQ